MDSSQSSQFASLVAQVLDLCTQLQSKMVVSTDPVALALRECTKDWTRDHAVWVLRHLYMMPAELAVYAPCLFKHLHVSFQLTKQDAQSGANYALRWSAVKGHLGVLQYLKEGFGLGKEDAQADKNYALKWSARYGQLEVLKYLKEGFGLGKEDAQCEDNFALRLSAKHGHLEVLK